jgi:hypothetical protein
MELPSRLRAMSWLSCPMDCKKDDELEMGRAAKFGLNLGHNADFVAVKKQF